LRVHSFSSDAQILSAMLHIKSGGAMWSGPPVVVFPSSPDFLKAFRSLLTQNISAMPLEQIDAQHALWKFLSTLRPVLASNGMTFALSEAADNRVEQSRRFLDALPLDQPWDRIAVAASARVSASQLDRLWRESLEQTPHHYWELRRRRYACEQLENSPRSIKEIALDLGFVHFSQFSNWFRKSLGWTPSHHRLVRPS
jgi:AraC family transcriptional regulator